MKQKLYRWIGLSIILVFSLASSIAMGENLNISPFFKEDFANNQAV